MLISMSKFYKEVTGKKTCTRTVTGPALKRWGVPYNENGKKGDGVDASYLDVAKAAWRAEQAVKAERASKRAPRPKMNGAHTKDLAANTRALGDLQAAVMLLTEALARSAVAEVSSRGKR